MGRIFRSSLLALAVLALSAPAEAQRLRLTKSNPNFYLVDFGDETRSGFGGYPTGCSSPCALTGTGSSDWTIVSPDYLVPSGAYAAVKTFSRSNYTLATADGKVIQITMVPNRSDIRAMSSDTSTTHQLYTLVATDPGAGALCLGDTVMGRTSYLNPTSAAWLLRPRATYADCHGVGGRITIRSEVLDNSLDANGWPVRMHGFQIGALANIGNSSGDVSYPIDFEGVWFRHSVFSTQPAFDYNTDVGQGYGFRNFRVSNDVGVANPESIPGLSLNGYETVEDGTFTQTGKAVTFQDGFATVRRNVFMVNRSDTIDFTQGGNVIEYNTAFDWRWTAANHPDFIQGNPPLLGSGPLPANTIRYNTAWRGTGSVNGTGINYIDFQCIFPRNQTGVPYYNNDVVTNNICSTTMSNAILASTMVGPNISRNTALANFQYQPVIVTNPPGSSPNAFIIVDDNLGDQVTTPGSGYTDGVYSNRANTGGSGTGRTVNVTVAGGVVTYVEVNTFGSGYLPGDVVSVAPANMGGTGSGFTDTLRSLAGSGGRFDRNVVNQLSISAMPGIVSQTNNKLLTKDLPTYQSYFPAYNTSPTYLVNRPTFLYSMTPSSTGNALNVDGTFSGALFPACPGQTTGAWNDGTVWNCSDGTWLAAHPPAT